jgi:hypothetical protein
MQRSAVVFALCTGLQFLIGMWLLLVIPRDIVLSLLGQPLAGAVFGIALMAAIAAMLLILLGSMAPRPALMVQAGFGATMITLFMMVSLRYLLRIEYLKPYADLGALAVRPQVGVIVLFLLLFVGGLATVGYMLWLVARAGKAAVDEVTTGSRTRLQS